MKAIGRLVALRFVGPESSVRVEGRVAEQVDSQLVIEVDVAGGPAQLRELCQPDLRVEVEIVQDRTVYVANGGITYYSGAFPYKVGLRVDGSFRPAHQRRHARIPTEIPVRVVVKDPHGVSGRSEVLQGTVVDLSPGGAGIRMEAQLRCGDQVDLSFAPGRFITPAGRVARVESSSGKFVVGVAFTDISDSDMGGLQSYLAEHGTVA